MTTTTSSRAAGDAPITIDIEDQSDAYNVVQLEYLDRTNQYNMAIALASDAANVAQYGMRRKDPDTVHCDLHAGASRRSPRSSGCSARSTCAPVQVQTRLDVRAAGAGRSRRAHRRRAGPRRLHGPHHPDRRGREGRHARRHLRGLCWSASPHTPLYTMQDAAPTRDQPDGRSGRRRSQPAGPGQDFTTRRGRGARSIR